MRNETVPVLAVIQGNIMLQDIFDIVVDETTDAML